MLIDLTLPITKEMIATASTNNDIVLNGHTGTHFDVMNKIFPLEYTKLKGYAYNCESKKEISSNDVDLSKLEKGYFVGFYTNWINEAGYSTKRYHSEQPVLTDELIDKLIEKGVCIIGIDFPGVRKGSEHTPKDQYCADRNVFIVENMVNLDKVMERNDLVVNTFPINYIGYSGLPTRVVAYINK